VGEVHGGEAPEDVANLRTASQQAQHWPNKTMLVLNGQSQKEINLLSKIKLPVHKIKYGDNKFGGF
jgi:hypothetical protein